MQRAETENLQILTSVLIMDERKKSRSPYAKSLSLNYYLFKKKKKHKRFSNQGTVFVIFFLGHKNNHIACIFSGRVNFKYSIFLKPHTI